jgi:predicted dehydrogenase
MQDDRFAVISGAGAAGVLHALAYRAAGVRIAAVFDPDAQRARNLADAVGATPVPTLEALAEVRAAFASVAGPPPVHLAQATLLAEGGRTVVVEKPVATTLGELRRLVAIGRCVPVVQWRAGRALRCLRAAIAAGELGAAPAFACDLDWARDADYLRVRSGWRCGALVSVGIHAVDAITWALDRPIVEVSGVTSTRRGAAAATSAALLLRFAGGAVASLRVSFDGAADATRIVACGGGVSATIAGGEADPTARELAFTAAGDAARRRLEALARETSGAVGPPLIVPYIAGIVGAVRDGERPGDSERIPSIESTALAHAAALMVEGSETGSPERYGARRSTSASTSMR